DYYLVQSNPALVPTRHHRRMGARILAFNFIIRLPFCLRRPLLLCNGYCTLPTDSWRPQLAFRGSDRVSVIDNWPDSFIRAYPLSTAVCVDGGPRKWIEQNVRE